VIKFVKDLRQVGGVIFGGRGRVRVRDRVMVFSATFNNVSVILWSSLLLVEDTGVPPSLQK
jgi:hypothetical protein